MKTTCAAVLCLALLGACSGGGSEETASPMTTAAPVNFAEESQYGPVDRASTPGTDRSAMPADHAARTRPGLYLRLADAERWDRRLRGDVVWLDAGCCAGADAEMALLTAYGMQAAKNLGNDAPFFVTGSDLRLAATLVNRLADTGSPRAYLVTP